MKCYHDLYDQITTFDNLYLAYRLASRGKRGQPQVSAFDFNLEANLFQLQDELRQQAYRPGAYYSFYINDPKRRLVSAAPFRDLAEQQADPAVYEAEVGLMALTLDAAKIEAGLNRVRNSS